MSNDSWTQFLSAQEREWLSESSSLLESAPPPKGGVWAWGQSKVEAGLAKVPESVTQQVTQAVSKALETMQHGSTWLVSEEEVSSQLSSHLGYCAQTSFKIPLPALDCFAEERCNWFSTGLTIEGVAAGAAGLVGLAADIPILYASLFKMIQEISWVYGFSPQSPAEKLHLFNVLDLGHCWNSPHRVEVAHSTFQLQSQIRKGVPVEELAAWQVSPSTGAQTQALFRNMRLARELALALLERKLFQGFVVIGSAIGGFSNYHLSREAGLATRHVYRRRHLFEKALRRALGEGD